MFKTASISLILAFFSCFVNAQTGNNTITGSITDSTTIPIDFANVLLLSADSNKLIKADVTGEKGFFEFTEIENGTFVIKVLKDGFQTFITDKISVAGRTTLPAIKLLPTAKKLSEVTVQAQKPLIEFKAGKLVVNVESSIMNAGSSVLEVLGRSPGVTVDQSENIKLKGKPGVMVMMNGKVIPVSGADLANMLKSMPSSSIEKIEIISNPGARYDAAGSGGIINLISKKDKRKGMNGTANASYGQGVYRKWNGGANINYRKDKLNINASYNYGDRIGFNYLGITRQFYQNNQLMTTYTQDNTTVFPIKNHTGNVAVDYNLSSKTTIGFSIMGNRSRYNPRGDNFSRVDSGSTSTYFSTTNRSHDAWNNYSANAYLRHSFDTTGRELSVDIDYGRYWSQTYQTFTNKYYNNKFEYLIPDYILYGDLSGITQIRSLKADYVHPLSKKIKLEAGIKTSYVTADTEPLFFDKSDGITRLDSTKSNHFIYKENINAGYLNTSIESGKWSIQAGLRAEQTVAHGNQITTGQEFDRNYTQLFPSLAVQRNFNKDHDLGITLARRIDRPGYRQLNPFKFFLDPTNSRVGNPYLRPTLTYSSELTHTFKQRFITTFTYSITKDVIVETLEADPEHPNTSMQSDKNLASQYYYGLSIAYPFKITKWWNATVNLNAYRSIFEGRLSNTDLNRGGFAMDVNVTNAFTLPKGFSAELSGYYQSPMVWGFYELKPISMVNLGAQKTLLDKRGTIKLSYTDIFWNSAPSADIHFNNFTESFVAKRETRVFTVSLVYRFGQNNNSGRRHRSGAEDEKRRVGSAG